MDEIIEISGAVFQDAFLPYNQAEIILETDLEMTPNQEVLVNLGRARAFMRPEFWSLVTLPEVRGIEITLVDGPLTEVSILKIVVKNTTGRNLILEALSRIGTLYMSQRHRVA